MKENIINSLDLLWKGMLAVFLVMAVIFIIILIMNAVTKSYRRKKAEKQKEEDPLSDIINRKTEE